MSEACENYENESTQLVHEYMERAARARATGDKLVGLHLFLAAYAESARASGKPTAAGVSALKEAWALALQLKERSLAEYVFERLEPALQPDEMKACSDSLQGLALDKLEQFGISRKDLEEVSGLIAQSLDGEEIRLEGVRAQVQPVGGAAGCAACSCSCSDSGEAEAAAAAETAVAEGEGPTERKIVLAKFPLPQPPEVEFHPQSMRYADLAGYANAIRQAKALGIGESRDPGYTKLVQELNAAHGLSEPPAFDPILITAPAREDAARFAFATAGELDQPLFRMYVEDNPQGLQALCLSAQQTSAFKFDRKSGVFEGKGILLLEDIDLWELPTLPEMADGEVNPFIAAQISRSLREVYNFIRTAVEDPNVTVLVTAESVEQLSPFFLSLLEPYRTVAIEMPSAGERASIWMQLLADHPSLGGISVAMLVKNSAHMARYDIYMVVADALDESYRDDLNSGKYRPVKPSRLFEKLAAFQPVDSEEYKTLEDAIISDFRSDLANLDDLLKN